ncbi:MAG: peptidoglycan editing factor PgeF [Peptococcaceae bacterium]
MAFHVGDNPEMVLKNRLLISRVLGISPDSFTGVQQVHGDKVKIITEELKGAGPVNCDSAVSIADAMVTNVPDVCLMVLQADCVPVLLFDPQKKVIGAAHAGWKGTFQMVAQKAAREMQEKFGCLTQDIMAGIGPSIGPCCYEVGPEVIAQAKNIFREKKGYIGKETPEGKGYFNLWEANKIQLIQMGIPVRNIEVAGTCTSCYHNLFFSARRQGRKTGRFGAGIMLKNL